MNLNLLFEIVGALRASHQALLRMHDVSAVDAVAGVTRLFSNKQ
jgi:hypothetical protein